MKAMIFAAGLGTRLGELTRERPKALVKIGGFTLLELALKKLRHFGIDSCVINVHHYSQQIIDYCEERDNFGMELHFSKEEKLLDTGGGLKFAKDYFTGDNTILLYNVDILSDIDLGKFYQFHQKHKALASLAVQNRDTSRYLLFDNSYSLKGWINRKTSKKFPPDIQEENYHFFAFSGIHLLNTALFDYFPDDNIFSITKFYLDLSEKYKILAYEHSEDFWIDAGKTDSLQNAENYIKRTYG